MRPVSFEGCFGWLHPASGGRGVVLCSPFGEEAVSLYRVWRGLACQLAEAGCPTLRFDYPGTGNSAGAEADPERVEAWLGSVAAAVSYLREQTGVTEVAIVGIRLGALLGAIAAERIPGVAALALIAPVVSGKNFAREMKAFSRMKARPSNVPAPRPEWKDDIEALNSVLTMETIADLSQLDLRDRPSLPAPRILLMNRADLPVDPALAARFRDLGAEFEEAKLADYLSLTRPVYLVEPPIEAFSLLTRWLTQGMSPATQPPTQAAAPARIILPDSIEEPVFFGPDAAFYGVVCRPKHDQDLAPKPPILFVDIGADRLNLVLARRFASLGIISLRIDVAGLRESNAGPKEPGQRLYDLGSCHIIQAGVDWLEERGHPNCWVIGLCAGAYLGFHTALRDPRITGLVLINAQTFQWRDGDSLEVKKVSHYLKTAIEPGAWWRLRQKRRSLPKILYRLVTHSLKRVQQKVLRVIRREIQEPRPIAGWFDTLIDRGVNILMVYSAEDYGLENIEKYLGPRAARLAGYSNFDMKIIEGADHTLNSRWARDHLRGLLEEHFSKRDAQAALEPLYSSS